MSSDRVRIVDIAEELGLSTATVSNVIHGKTKKISHETVKRVQDLLEQKQYIPSMAGILLAQNNSRIIGVVINDHEKYQGHVLEDGFISSALNALSGEIDASGSFMMVKVTDQWNQIARFASMWNMDGLILMGFCEQDYQKLRENMHIPFVVYDGFRCQGGQLASILVDNFSGGVQAGTFLQKKGHQKVLCISDNDICSDHDRIRGFRTVYPDAELLLIPMNSKKRQEFYEQNLSFIRKHTAVFAMSDYYGVDLLTFLQSKGVSIPREISIVGFDDSQLCTQVHPALTTIRQDNKVRARMALSLLSDLKEHRTVPETCLLPVSLVERDSVWELSENCTN